MGSVDEGWSHDQGSAEISVELNEVALEKLASGDPCLMPCVDCGLVTHKFCDLCWGEDHFPQDKWAHGRLIPLCNRCDLMYLQGCHFCRGEDWCVPAAHWYPSIQTSYKYLLLSVSQAQGYKSDEIVKNRQKQLFTHMVPYLPEHVLSYLQSTENARPSSSSTEAA